jgi:hypothetical protein
MARAPRHEQRRAERRRAPRHKVNEMTNEERFLLNLIRREDRNLKNFTLALTADGDDCRATLQSHVSGAVLGGRRCETLNEALKLHAP